MIRRAALVLLLAAGCGDPKLDVTFQITDPYRDEINSATLRVYQPLPAAPFDCDQLAFGQVDPEVLRLSLVSEISLITTSEAPLEVDRTAAKLFWADALDGAQRRVVTGCAEQGEIERDTEVVIQGEPTKLVTVTTHPSLSIQSGAELTDPIVLKVTDLDKRDLGGVEVRWEIDGAGGSGSRGVATSSASGNAAILPELPTRPGPFVLDVAIRWAEQDPEPVTGFVQPEVQIGYLPGPVDDYRAGPIGPNGEPGFAALIEGLQFDTYKVAYVYRNPEGATQMRISQNIVTTAPRLGLIEAPRKGERARAIVLGLEDWKEIDIDGNVVARAGYAPPTGFAPVEIAMSGPCEPGSPPQIFVNYESNIVGIFDDQGLGNIFTADFDLIASGCVTDEVAGLVRVLIVEDQAGANLFVTNLMGDTLIGQAWLAVPEGIGFAPAIGASNERLLLGTQLSVNDVVISRYIVRIDQQTLSLVERGLDSPTGIPLYTNGGDIDGDQLLDVVSLVDQRADILDLPRYALWAALGRERESQRITGDFQIPGGELLRDPEMLLVDFDRDGTDDVIIGERTPGLAVSQTRFEVFSMGAVTPR